MGIDREGIQCWLLGPDGVALRVPAGGALLGRSASCDVIAGDPRASKRHALVRLGAAGPELVLLGRNPTYLNKQPIDGVVTLRHGDRIDLPGLRLQVEVVGDVRERVAWVLERTGSGSYGVHRTPYVVGGGPDDDLRIGGWPGAAVTLHQLGYALVARFAVEALLDEDPVDVGEVIRVAEGSTIRIGSERIVALADGSTDELTTVRSTDDPFPDAVIFEQLEVGGELELAFGSEFVRLRLDDEQALLVSALLRPRGGLEAGDFVPDEHLVRLIWPGQPNRDATHIDVLLRRTRERFLQTGSDPFRVFERAPRTTSTRFRVGPFTRLSLA